jgi:hypothetical protein
MLLQTHKPFVRHGISYSAYTVTVEHLRAKAPDLHHSARKSPPTTDKTDHQPRVRRATSAVWEKLRDEAFKRLLVEAHGDFYLVLFTVGTKRSISAAELVIHPGHIKTIAQHGDADSKMPRSLLQFKQLLLDRNKGWTRQQKARCAPIRFSLLGTVVIVENEQSFLGDRDFRRPMFKDVVSQFVHEVTRLAARRVCVIENNELGAPAFKRNR